MADWSLLAHLGISLGLGLFAFIEPCAIGGHMVFLGTLADQSRARRFTSLIVFVATRTVTLGIIGVVVALIGQHFIAGQKLFWLLFGAAYVGLGSLYLAGKAGVLMRRLGLGRRFADDQRSVVVLGIVLGLSVPACAAPLLLAVAASAARTETYALGFVSMGLFGLALTAPLLLVAIVPRLARTLDTIRSAPSGLRRVMGGALVGLGLWSIWFGLFVDPTDWQLGP